MRYFHPSFISGLIGSALLISAGFVFALLSSCEKKDVKEINRLSRMEDTLDVEWAEGVELSYSDSGVLRARIFSKVMQHFKAPEPKTEMRDGLSGYFYQDGEIESSLFANYGVSYDEKKLMEARENVMVKNKKGEELSTEKLFWDQNTQRIYTDAFVKIKRDDQILFGNGFESNETFTKYRILQLTGTVNVKD